MLDARVPQAAIPEVYGRLAPLYDLWAGLEARARASCLARAGPVDGEAVLEVAVGTGIAFCELVRANPTGLTEGVDLTEAMLARARAKVEGLPGRHRLRVGDAHRLDFADQSFDLVWNGYMFDLLPQEDFAPVLAEFLRVLKPGGRLAIVDMAATGSVVQRLYEHLYRVCPRLMGGCRGVCLSPSLAAAGFEGIDARLVWQLGFASEVVTARRPKAAA
jgi:ubiquinone/menaquinone biosynthesis C-methylase UbiE